MFPGFPRHYFVRCACLKYGCPVLRTCAPIVYMVISFACRHFLAQTTVACARSRKRLTDRPTPRARHTVYERRAPISPTTIVLEAPFRALTNILRTQCVVRCGLLASTGANHSYRLSAVRLYVHWLSGDDDLRRTQSLYFQYAQRHARGIPDEGPCFLSVGRIPCLRHCYGG